MPSAVFTEFCCHFVIIFVQHYTHRRRIKTEEKAKVVAAAVGTELIQLLAAQAILHQDNLKNRMISNRTIWRIGWIAPGRYEEWRMIYDLTPFFKSSCCKIVKRGKELNNCCPQTADLCLCRLDPCSITVLCTPQTVFLAVVLASLSDLPHWISIHRWKHHFVSPREHVHCSMQENHLTWQYSLMYIHTQPTPLKKC